MDFPPVSLQMFGVVQIPQKINVSQRLIHEARGWGGRAVLPGSLARGQAPMLASWAWKGGAGGLGEVL